MGELGGIANEGTVTEITIFQSRTITIHQTVTVNCETGALPRFACVLHRARVTIVAIGQVVLCRAATKSVAKIIRARVTIIADHR